MEPNSLRTESNKLDSKLSEIRLSIKHPSNENKVFILLEGSTDIKLFRKFFAKEYTDTTSLDGKEKVIQALEKLIAEGYTKIIGIKDADFDHLLNIQPAINNLFITDLHDMEIQMIESNALDSLIAEYGNMSMESLDIKEKIYQIALEIGYARYFDEKKKQEGKERDLAFDSLKFQNFIQLHNQQFIFNEENFLLELISESKARKPSLQLTKEELKSGIESVKLELHDKKQMCSGHDLTKLLGLLLRKTPNGDEIEKALRLSYSVDNFQITTLYKNLNIWAINNSKILF